MLIYDPFERDALSGFLVQRPVRSNIGWAGSVVSGLYHVFLRSIVQSLYAQGWVKLLILIYQVAKCPHALLSKSYKVPGRDLSADLLN